MGQQSKVGRTATNVFTDDAGALCCVYHSTCVAKRMANGTIKLNSGGWRTVTTKLRMNQFARQYGVRYMVYQKDFDWFVHVSGRVIPFADNMEFTI